MADSHGIVTQNARTTLGTQDYEKAGLGTVKGYLGLMTSVLTANTDVDDIHLSIGASDLGVSDNHLQAFNYEDNVPTSDSKSFAFNNQLFRGDDAGTDSGDEIAVHNATLTNGVQVDWTAVQAAHETSAILFKEGIEEFDVQTVVANATGVTTITPGFQIDGVIIICSGVTAVNQSPNNANFSVGFYDTTRYSSFWIDGDNGLTTPTTAQFHSISNVGGQVSSAGVLRNHFTIGNITATSFDVTKVANTDAQVLQVISFKMAAGYQLQVGTASAPVSTGIDSTISGLPFQPQLALFAGNSRTTAGGDDDEGGIFFGAADADAQVCVGGAIQDFTAVNNTNCNCWHRDDSSIYLKTGSNSLLGQAAFNAFTSDGVDFNWTTAAGGAFQIGYMAFGSAGATQKSANDSGAFGTAAEDPISNIFLELFDQGNFVAEEFTAQGFLGGRIDGDTDGWDAVETGSIFSSLLFKSASDDGAFSSTESGSINTGETVLKGPGVESVTNFTSVETSTLVQLGPTEQKAATDEGAFDDLTYPNFALRSDDFGNPAWTKNALSITPDAQDGNDLLSKPSLVAAECNVEQTVTTEQASQETQVLAWVLPEVGNEPAWVYLALENITGKDLGAWFEWTGSGWNYGTVGADVSSSGRFLQPDGYWELEFIFVSDAADLTGDVQLGIAEADGAKNITASGTAGLLVDNLQVSPYKVINGQPITNTRVVSEGAVNRAHQEVVAELLQVDSVFASTDDGAFSVVESEIVVIAGTVDRFSSDLGSFVAAEDAFTTEELFALDEGAWAVTETGALVPINYDPSWEDDDVIWGGLQLTSKDFVPVFAKGPDFFALGEGDATALSVFLERKAAVFDKGRAILGREIFPQIIGPLGGVVQISMGGHNTPDGAIDWEGPYDFVIGEDISVDFAVAGRYLSVRYESTLLGSWSLSSHDIDYEIVGVY